jgi:DNA polymerase III alpha subunit
MANLAIKGISGKDIATWWLVEHIGDTYIEEQDTRREREAARSAWLKVANKLEAKKLIATTTCFDWKQDAAFAADVVKMNSKGYVYVYDGDPGSDQFCPVYSKVRIAGAQEISGIDEALQDNDVYR